MKGLHIYETDKFKEHLKTLPTCVLCINMVVLHQDIKITLESYDYQHTKLYVKNSLICKAKIGSEGICNTYACTPSGTMVLDNKNEFVQWCSYNNTELKFRLLQEEIV